MPFILLMLLVFAGTSLAQVDAIRAEIRALYVPDPQQPNIEMVRAKIFFTAVQDKPNRAEYLEAIRAELEDRSNRAFMLVDGCARLLSISNASEDNRLAARVLARANFREVGLIPYHGVASQLASRNIDVSAAVFRLLEQPDIAMLWVQGFSFDQASLVASLLMKIDQKYWADSAVERLAAEEDPTAQATLLWLLWYAQTDFADSELAAFAKNSKKPASARALAQELVAREPNVPLLDRTEVLAASEDELRERRRRRQAGGVYFRNIMPTIQGDTMKILLKRRLAASEGAN